MARITVLGGTGYAGGAIAREAASRGHQVTIFSRTAPEQTPAENIVSETGSALNHSDLERVISGAEVVVVALAPHTLEGRFEQVAADVADLARAGGARLGLVGGAGSLLAEDGRQVYETDGYPAQYTGGAKTHLAIIQALRASDESLDWFVISPPTEFGSYAPGTATGQFRVGGEVLVTDADGRSVISGADFATAFVNEIEQPAHHRERFTVAY